MRLKDFFYERIFVDMFLSDLDMQKKHLNSADANLSPQKFSMNNIQITSYSNLQQNILNLP